MFFVPKILLTQHLKDKIWLPNLKHQLKNKYPPLAKNFTKGCHSVVTHVLYHFCDTSLITFGLWNLRTFLQSKASCCLHIYFLWRHDLSPNKSENHQDSDFDWFTYCIDIWLLTLKFSVFNIWVSHALEMTIHFYYPTFELFCFSFTRLSLKILFTQPFSLRCHPPPSIMIGPLRTYLLIVQTLTIQRSVVQSRISANPGLKCNLLF
jgi:hypothetical protein